MSPTERAAIREAAKQTAAAAPPLSTAVRDELRLLLSWRQHAQDGAE